jgi:hypothetical protein
MKSSVATKAYPHFGPVAPARSNEITQGHPLSTSTPSPTSAAVRGKRVPIQQLPHAVRGAPASAMPTQQSRDPPSARRRKERIGHGRPGMRIGSSGRWFCRTELSIHCASFCALTADHDMSSPHGLHIASEAAFSRHPDTLPISACDWLE